MPLCSHCLPITPPFLALAPRICSSSKLFASPRSRFLGLRMRNKGMDIFLRPRRHGVRVRSSSGRGDNQTVNNAPVDRFVKRRKIVEHVILLQAKVELSDVDEKDMLDFVFTSQYHMRGIIALSLGRVEDSNVDNITHAVYMRFQRREDLARFSANPHFLEVLKEHVFPYCYGSLSVDFESEVEDDMLSIFRRGEVTLIAEFNYGVECVLLISVFEASLGHAIEDAILALQSLMEEFRSIIVQGTIGSNFSNGDSEYTHAAIIRFYTLQGFEMFRCSPKYKDMWKSKFQPITKKSLLIHFNVDPVGTELL
ncbi:uncharacterized protein LOC110098908 isoform X1 [Dendrobium catenatum]|uniref:uncharacterized protein LOC110098908 isoform X1 n=1 Tax=Dendrobium catenatum TaxID=906689 RepID=UPI0009F2D852|nr:uncharacterized protein LOC110098908 isoform X1 [Dendrobium catenatum]XP_028555573.1 uncharacterized protein LOC110098908 isoform X1 [Dendrobium catenatum]XP_028555574.1 uncharacterized protein LOC110098908 isoform X1 [Dendrobium catenatum]